VVDLEGTDTSLSQWLLDLPCPTIGIGAGGLSGACDVLLEDRKQLDPIVSNITNAPITAMILVQHLRASERLDLQDALTAESFAYATAQKGPEFLAWLSSQESAGQRVLSLSSSPLIVNIDGAHMDIVLNDPDNRNAMGVEMRDALCEALDLALADQSYAKISLTGAGRTFSTGGEVSEFGDISDPSTAHWVRSLRLPAWRLARLKDRLKNPCQWGSSRSRRRDCRFRDTCQRLAVRLVSASRTQIWPDPRCGWHRQPAPAHRASANRLSCPVDEKNQRSNGSGLGAGG